jgi:tryptophanyl-tRNA synthetase
MKTVFSGIQPSGNLHIGNYIGAISQWKKMQGAYDCIFCIVDLHAITVPQEPKVLKEKSLEMAALYLACGLDKSNIFIQSENPDHPYLAWVLNTITSFGQLERMTQFKEKAQKHEENAGLFDYPVLMAADILLYQTDEVPVGQDQKQHIELARDLAEKFNSRFGQTFKLPNPLIQKQTARIMSLQDAFVKMSKSDVDPMGTINLLDPEEAIREKVKKAITDSDSSVSEKHSKQHGAIANLLTIYSAFSGLGLEETLDKFKGVSYSEFKQSLADLLVSELKPIQEKYQALRKDESHLREVLSAGLKNVREKSAKTIEDVKSKVGLG